MVLRVGSQFHCEAKRSTRRAGCRRGEFVLRPRKRPILNLSFDRTSMYLAKSGCPRNGLQQFQMHQRCRYPDHEAKFAGFAEVLLL